MRIGDAAAAAGMTPRALRYYEQQGLVTARRTPSGHRVYDAEDVRRLSAVRELRDAGLTVGDVREFAHLLRTMPSNGVPDLIPTGREAGPCSAVETVARQAARRPGRPYRATVAPTGAARGTTGRTGLT